MVASDAACGLTESRAGALFEYIRPESATSCKIVRILYLTCDLGKGLATAPGIRLPVMPVLVSWLDLMKVYW